MNSEVLEVLSSDFRALIGPDVSANWGDFPVSDQAMLVERAYAGYEAIDHIIRLSVRPTATSQLEALTNVRITNAFSVIFHRCKKPWT